MTHIDNCFMLPMNSIIDRAMINEIKFRRHSQIPVYVGDKADYNIEYVLYARDLLSLDPEKGIPLRDVIKKDDHKVNFIYAHTSLNLVYNKLKNEIMGDLTIVKELTKGEFGYKTVGIITFHDIFNFICEDFDNEFLDIKDLDHLIPKLSDIKEAFEEFDEDNDGYATIDDVGNMMKFLNLNPTDAELKIIMDEVDTNTDG